MGPKTLDQHIEITPGIAGGKPRIAGHRITVQNIAIWHERLGRSADEIATEYGLIADAVRYPEDRSSVTYRLNPKAVWSDGTPITCADVAFTWKAVINTTGSYTQTPYSLETGGVFLSNVDCSKDARTVRLEFNKVYIDWPDVFGGDPISGAPGFIIEKAAFPSEADDRPDLKDEMHDSISFSDGP